MPTVQRNRVAKKTIALCGDAQRFRKRNKWKPVVVTMLGKLMSLLGALFTGMEYRYVPMMILNRYTRLWGGEKSVQF